MNCKICKNVNEAKNTKANIEIISNGTGPGTAILCNGKQIRYVQKISWSIDKPVGLATVEMTILKVPVTIKGTLKEKKEIKVNSKLVSDPELIEFGEKEEIKISYFSIFLKSILSTIKNKLTKSKIKIYSNGIPIEEGKVSKGGLNTPPTAPRPEPPKAMKF